MPKFNSLGVPAGVVQTVQDALSDPQTRERGLVQRMDDLSLMGSPIVQDGHRSHPQSAPPTLGEHNDDIWGELGLDETEILRLRNEGIL